MRVLSPTRALRHFGFRQTLRGALIVGALSGCMFVLQGVAYQKSYPDEAARAKFAASLTSAPALGLLYGDARNLAAGTNGYMVYRVTSFMAMITSIWGLVVTTRLLRGNEEDGRWETMRTAAIPVRQLTLHTMMGFARSWAVGLVLSALIVIGITTLAGINLPVATAVVINLMIFLPGLLFAAVGVLTSQLALTRQRALLYGLLSLLGLFLARGVANTSADLHWLMNFTPFGWMELVNPVLGSQNWWLLLPVAFGGLFVVLGIWLAQRDLGSSVIRQSETTRSRYFWLGKSWQLGLRQNMLVSTAWTLGALFVAGLMAGLSTIAVQATSDSKNLSKSLGALAGNYNNIRIAFLGAGLIILVIILMVMAVSVVSSIRSDEAKQYLDTILVQPVRRTTWLASRLVLGLTTILLVSLAAGMLTYVIASGQNIPLSLGKIIATSLCLVGGVAFLTGLGTFMYGLKPRLAAPLMYAVIGWSFLITLLSSFMKLSTSLAQSSLFHYASFNLAAWPDWTVFAWLTTLGLTMALIGTLAFAKRDILAE